ncbi:uncharacterized protein LOC123558969 [Mercenaria mercenaria]|uniref:uncharacterized protein LOC123558969 n=1 Tax=Mercenaria mercenaria TaxID=6596 RepID=UPI00234EE0F6|nr:uncharacterized protein LOC123558969 [Mercenaria mercenaria]
MENRNPKGGPKSVSEEEKMLAAQRVYKTNSFSKQQELNETNDLSDLNNIQGPHITEEQGPDNEAPTPTARDSQRSPMVCRSNISSELPVKSETVSAGDISEDTGTPDASQTEYMEQITSLSKNSGPTEISKVYQSVYTNDWNKIFSSVRKENSERHSIEFLKEILKLSYDTSVENANSQIELMMKEAMELVRGEKSPTDKANMQGDVEILKEYRRMNSTLSLPYLKQNFFKTHLPLLQQKYSIPGDPVPSKNLLKFVSKCVEVTWFACIHDPSLVLGFNFEPKRVEELNQAVTSFKPDQKGRRLQYIVWPPLRLYKDGPIISKGVAVLM